MMGRARRLLPPRRTGRIWGRLPLPPAEAASGSHILRSLCLRPLPMRCTRTPTLPGAHGGDRPVKPDPCLTQYPSPEMVGILALGAAKWRPTSLTAVNLDTTDYVVIHDRSKQRLGVPSSAPAVQSRWSVTGPATRYPCPGPLSSPRRNARGATGSSGSATSTLRPSDVKSKGDWRGGYANRLVVS
jgi:hypothetical protein